MSRRRTALAALPLLLAATACASVPPQPQPSSPCGADRAMAFVGRQASPEVRAQVATAVGSRTIRWIGPGDVVTMDFSETRLNMMLDANGTITAVRCG